MKRSAATVWGVGFFGAIALLTGCSGEAEPNPTQEPSASLDETGRVSSLDGLRDVAVDAGYDCSSWSADDAEKGACSENDRFMFFPDDAARETAVENFENYLENGYAEAVLVGANWAINSEPEALASLEGELGGELLLPAEEDASSEATGEPSVTPGLFGLSDLAADIDEVVAAVESTGIACDWQPDSMNPDFETRCDDPRIWVFHDSWAPEDMAMMDSKGELWDTMFDGGVTHGDNWIVGADWDVFGDVIAIGGSIGYP